MGYTVALTTGASSQNEGTPGAAASFTFTLTRQAGDSAGPYSIQIYDVQTGGFNTTDFNAVANFNFAGADSSVTFTVTAAVDATVEINESFQAWVFIAGNPASFLQSANFTLTNDDFAAPVFSTNAAISVAENVTAVATIQAAGTGTTTYSLNGGVDAGLFAIDANSGALTFTGGVGRNFEAPGDVGANNVYDVTVRATASGITADRAFAVTVTNAFDVAPVITSNAGGDNATINMAENITAVTTVTSTDAETGGGDTVTYSISGGANAGSFQINSATGALSFVTAPNFEVGPLSYVVDVRATDAGGTTDTQVITVNITNVAENPVITSNGGANFAVVRIPENTATTTAVTTVTATDSDGTTPTYAINGGADAGAFTINAATGVLTINVSPNFEAPADFNADGMYEVIVRATDGVLTDDQTLYVFVDNVIEAGVPTDVPTTPGTPVTPPTPPTNAGNDNLTGTAASEYIAGGAGDDTISAGSGDDAVDGDAGNDYVLGGDGADFVRGLDGDDLIDGGAGDDDVNGNTGVDDVRGGEGADTVRGGQGNDIVYGNEGDDGHVNGNIGDDIVRGGEGNDTCYGGQGNDSVYGDGGNDRLFGDLGNDNLFGGAGADKFGQRVGGGADWVGDFNAAEGDRILLAPGQGYTVSNAGGQVLIVLSSGDTIGLAGVSFSSFSSTWVEFG